MFSNVEAFKSFTASVQAEMDRKDTQIKRLSNASILQGRALKFWKTKSQDKDKEINNLKVELQSNHAKYKYLLEQWNDQFRQITALQQKLNEVVAVTNLHENKLIQLETAAKVSFDQHAESIENEGVVNGQTTVDHCKMAKM